MALGYEALKEGQELEPLVRPPISRVQLVMYAGASGDFNPLHIDDDFARRAGLDGVVAHGMLIMGFLRQYVMRLAAPAAELTRFKVRFVAPARPGDTITCSGTVPKLARHAAARLAALTVKARGEEACGSPRARGHRCPAG